MWRGSRLTHPPPLRSLRKRTELRLKQRWRARIDALRQQHQPLRVYISREAQHGVPVDAAVLEVDARGTAAGDDDLELER